MKKLTTLGLILSAVLVTSCADDTQTNTGITDFDREVGWLHGNCLAIKNPAIADGTPLTLVLLDEPKQMMTASVANLVEAGDVCLPIKTGRTAVNLANGYSFYNVDADVDIELAIGIINDSVQIKLSQFDYCTAAEGILYRIKATEQSAGSDLWQGYYYLDYDTNATCEMPEH